MTANRGLPVAEKQLKIWLVVYKCAPVCVIPVTYDTNVLKSGNEHQFRLNSETYSVPDTLNVLSKF